MITEKKTHNIVTGIYRMLYRESTPQADFDELVSNAKLNFRGEKEIDFMSYEISQNKYEYIIKSELDKHKLTKREKEKIKIVVALGCSPKFKDE